MSIALTCDCGRSLRLKDELAGRKIRCPTCNASLTVPKPEVNAEEEALDILLGDAPPEKAPARRAPVEGGIQAEEPSRPVHNEPPRPAPPPPKKPTTSKRRPVKDEEDSGGRRFGIAINGNIIIGGLMVIGAVAWFLIRLGQGWLVFGSLFLFVFGILRIVRGFRGDA